MSSSLVENMPICWYKRSFNLTFCSPNMRFSSSIFNAKGFLLFSTTLSNTSTSSAIETGCISQRMELG